jgi:predicted membrane protein
MKKSHLILIIVYLFVILYFAIFNWDVFVITLGISLGFTVINIPFTITLFLCGLLFILIQLGMMSIRNSAIEHNLEDKMNEINRLKAEQFDQQSTEIQKNTKSLNELHDKLNQLLSKFDIDDQENTSLLADPNRQNKE